jgi:hypothetical protein
MVEEASGSPSLVLVEQHEALRDGLAMLLERRGFDVLGCATTAARGGIPGRGAGAGREAGRSVGAR